MKSIKDQYNQLQEGKISQYNFMRNLRISLPQYVTNTTSFKDAVQILTNKGILNEGKKGHQLIDINSVDPVQLSKGTKVEMEHTDDPKKAQKIALDHLAEDPAYYSKLALSGLNDPEFKSKKKNDQPIVVTKKSLKDKANAEKTPKGVEKIKASANKVKKETTKPAKNVQIQTEKAKKAKGVKETMKQSGGKCKTIKLREMLGELEVPKNIYSINNEEIPNEIIVKRILQNKYSGGEEQIIKGQPELDNEYGFTIINIKNDNKLKASVMFHGNQFVEAHSSWHYIFEPMNDVAKNLFNKLKNKEKIDLIGNKPDEIDLYPGNMGDEMSAPNEGLNEDHLSSKEDKIAFIKQSGHYSKPEELDLKSEDEINQIYTTVEKISQQKKNPGVDLGSSFNKFKSKIAEIIKEVIDETNNEQ